MYVVATAGHVDHGKSTLIKALTGMEPDRWSIERQREMSIDLGFCWTTLPAGALVAFVDVPGHERYLTNTIAGLGPAQAVVLAVAADEGWMPQTAEHLAAIDALNIRYGLVAVTRSDLADTAVATTQAREHLSETLLADVPIVPVSARTGHGLTQLMTTLDDVLAAIPTPDPHRPAHLWVDRVFTIRGAGTVTTGTLTTGQIHVGDTLLVARTGMLVTIRGLQSLHQDVPAAAAVSRVAVNLRNIATTSLQRGDQLLTPDRWQPTRIIDIRHNAANRPLPREITAHVGTNSYTARTRPLGADTTRLSMADPIAAHIGDRLALRDPGTRHITAATVLDPQPPPLRRRGDARNRATDLADHTGIPDGHAELHRRRIATSAFLTALGVDPPGKPLIDEWHVDPDHARQLSESIRTIVHEADSDPTQRGVPVETIRQRLDLPTTRLTLALTPADIRADRGRLRPHADNWQPPPQLAAALEQLAATPFAGPDVETLGKLGVPPKLLKAAVAHGLLIRLGSAFIPADAVAAAATILHGLPAPFSASQARQALHTTRRVAIPLLEHLDATHITVRHRDGSRHMRETP